MSIVTEIAFRIPPISTPGSAIAPHPTLTAVLNISKSVVIAMSYL